MRLIINKILSASFIACMLVGGLLFNACESEEEMTDPVLKVFGPTPALRGGDLEFIGSNLDQITSVILPDNMQITDITVESPEKIIIAIPQDAKPGYITLVSKKGEIKTKTRLTFSEPILIKDMSPVNIKAGDEFTIDGNYLNLIKEVIFNDGITVSSENFISQSRYQIKVTVPVEAQSGKVIISNGEEIPILVYTSAPVNVALPAIASFAPATVKPGKNLQITGTDLQLVKSIIFPEALNVETFTVNEAKTDITVEVPAMAKEGKIKLVAFSGVEVESIETLRITAPAITSISPNPVKNGKNLTITGTNLDLATAVTFGGDVAGTISTQSETSIVVEVPETAKEGPVVLSTNSGKTVGSSVLKFVKPSISSVAPLTLMAGNDITITGTNLDLVKNVVFKEGQSVNITNTNETSLTVATPTAAVSGTFTLIAKNGDKVESQQAITLEAANKPVVLSMTSPVKPGDLLTITGTKMHLVESVVFAGNIKATSYGSRTATTIEVYVPQAAKAGKTTVTLNTFDGQSVVSPEFVIAGTDPITASTKMIMDFETRTSDGHAPDWDNWGGSYDAAKAKADGYLTLVSSPGWWVFGCNHPAPEGWPSVNTSDYVFKVDIKATTPIKINGTYEFLFLIGSEQISSQLIVEDGYIRTPNNDWATLTIPISGLTSPTKNSGDFGIVMNSNNGNDFAGLCFDNLRYDPK